MNSTRWKTISRLSKEIDPYSDNIYVYVTRRLLNTSNSLAQGHIISIFHGCMVWIEKSVTRVTDRHHEACRVMPNSDPE